MENKYGIKYRNENQAISLSDFQIPLNIINNLSFIFERLEDDPYFKIDKDKIKHYTRSSYNAVEILKIKKNSPVEICIALKLAKPFCEVFDFFLNKDFNSNRDEQVEYILNKINFPLNPRTINIILDALLFLNSLIIFGADICDYII